MRKTVHRALAALMALILFAGQLQPAASAQTLAFSDSSQEPPAAYAQEQEETSAPEQSCDAEPEESSGDESSDAAPDGSQSDGADGGEDAPGSEQPSKSETTAVRREPEKRQDAEADSSHTDETGEHQDRPASDSDAQTEQQTVVARFGEKEAEEECTIALSGELPEGAEVQASDAAGEAVEAGLKHIVCAYDITIDDGWQPEQPVEVSIANEDICGKVRVYHIGEDGRPERVKLKRSDDGKVVFQAEGFSIYVVTDDLFRRTYEFMDYKFGAWMPYKFHMTLPEDQDDPHHGVFAANRQILRNGDSLVVPSLPNKDNMRFLGWYTSPDADVNTLTPERGGVKNDITSDSIVTLYARYGSYVSLTFYTRSEGTTPNQVFSTRTVILAENAEANVLDLSELLSPEPPTQGLGFVGWREAGSQELVDLHHYTVRGDRSFYPVFSQQYQISFTPADENEEYFAPIWVEPQGVSGQLTDSIPTRPGYSFAGWQTAGDVTLTDESGRLLDGELSFPGGSLSGGVLRLSQDLALHALWTPEEVPYRVVFWQEKASDTKKLVKTGDSWSVPDAQKEYDYVGTLRRSAVVGTVVSAQSLLEEYADLGGNPSFSLDEGKVDFTGLRFCALKGLDGNALERLTVPGDGSGTVHVYYDRTVVTLRFDFPEDVTQGYSVGEPVYSPQLPASGTVTQKAVTAVSAVDYPEDIILTGLYAGPITDGKTEQGTMQWPVSYEAKNLNYTLTSRIMEFSNWKWNQKSSSSSTVRENSRSFPTHWVNEAGEVTDNLETFGLSCVLTPTHTLDNLRESVKDGTVSFFKENEQAAYPATPIYAATPAYSFQVVTGETVVAENPFPGFELDYATYNDSKGKPVILYSAATLTDGSFTNLKVYCKRKVHNIIFHNGSEELSARPGVKYNMSLATDYVKSFLITPEYPKNQTEPEEEMEFVGWFMDEERTIFLDFAGLKTNERLRLQQHYDNIHDFVSVYEYRAPGGQLVPPMLMMDSDLHLYAGWVRRRVLVEVEPEGGELPETLPTYFWADLGQTLNFHIISRDYVPWQEGKEAYSYHIHTYEQAKMDNDSSDRTARYVSAEPGEGSLYAYESDSYRFLGWFQVETQANGSEHLKPYDQKAPLTGDLKLRAQWSRKGVYRLVYDAGALGTLSGSVATASYRDHATIALNGNVTPHQGYVFTGWKIRRPNGSGELLEQLYSSGDELVINADWAEITMDEYAGEPRGVITLVAQYQPVTGTSVTYYVNGGSFVGPTEAQLELDSVLAQQLRDKLVQDYGKTAAHHYIYDAGGTIIGYTVSGIEQNANLTTEDGSWFQRSSFKLMGWSSTPTGSVELELHRGGFNAANDPEGKGHVLYAVWKAEQEVTYDLQGGSWNTSNGPEYRQEGQKWVYGAGYGERAPAPLPPTRSGYAFAGWSLSSGASSALSVLPEVKGNVTLYALWTTKVVLRFDSAGGTWESVPNGAVLLAPNCYGIVADPGSSKALPADAPVREGEYLFHKWEQGSYQYSPGEEFKTISEQAGQSVTFTALWSHGMPAVEVLVGADDSVSVNTVDSMVGSTEDGTISMAQREIPGYQFLFVTYNDEPQSKEEIAERYRVTAVRQLGLQTYQVTMANGQTKIHYPGSAEKLQAVYIQDRSVDVNLVRMNIFKDGLDNMNLKLSPIQMGYQQLSVGKVDLQQALPNPSAYAKTGGKAYTSFTYAIGRQGAENMYAIDTMTKDRLWVRQTLNGYAFSVNGEEWKDVDRESGSGKDVAIYIIYDDRAETLTTINHTVYGLKSDKEKLFTYQVYVKGRWGFNIGSGAYFLHLPDDASENLNSYTVALSDAQKVIIPLHIDWIRNSNYNQSYASGDLFYDMFGGEYRTRSGGTQQKRVWQEVEMRRANELPFTNGSFTTSIQMHSGSLFNGYDKVNHLWLKQLGISEKTFFNYQHSFIYRRTSLDVPIHVLEQTRDGLILRDRDWMKDGAQTLSVTANSLTVDETLAERLVSAPEGCTLQGVRYGLNQESLAGEDKDLILRLAAESNDETLLHVYDYTASGSDTRAVVPDGSEVYLIYYRHSSTEVPVEYVKKDATGSYTPVDLSGYGLSNPLVTVTNEEPVDFRSEASVLSVNREIEKLDAIYLTGRMLLANDKAEVLTTYAGGSYGDWKSGRELSLLNGENGVLYVDEAHTQQTGANVRVWVEVANNEPLRIVGRIWQRGSMDTNTGVFPYLPKDGENRVLAQGSYEQIEERFAAYQRNIPYASDPEVVYRNSSLGTEDDVAGAVAYCTDENGFRYWSYRAAEGAAPVSLTQILYANYTAHYSPVNVRYVLSTAEGFTEAEDLDVQAATSIRVDWTERLLSQVLEESLNAIDTHSTLYRLAGSFALGSADLKEAYYTCISSELGLQDGLDGLTYRFGTDSGTLAGHRYPDVYVVLRPIATLTVSETIRDDGGFALWDDSFTVTVHLDDPTFQRTYDAQINTDTSLDHAVPGGTQQVEFVNGTAQFTLRHAQSIAFPELPRGVRVTVTQQGNSRYETSCQIIQGAKVTEGNAFPLDRHTTVSLVNVSRDITDTGEDFSDGSAYALLLCGAASYGLYLLLRRRHQARAAK